MSTCADCCPPARSPALPEHDSIESNSSGREKNDSCWMIIRWGNFKKQKRSWRYLVGKEVNLRDCSILVMKAHELHTWSAIPEYRSRKKPGALSFIYHNMRRSKNQPTENTAIRICQVVQPIDVPPLNWSQLLWIESTQLNKFIRLPPHARIMLQLL